MEVQVSMRTIIEFKGTTPLVMHNIRLADKRDEYARAIAEITGKRKRTESDDLDIERFEWRGGLYYDAEMGVYVPAWNVVRCLERAATITRQGASLIRALAVTTDRLPLTYEGPKDLDALAHRPEYQWRTSVGVQRNKVTRVRPIFRNWGLSLEAEVLEDVLNPDDLRRIAELAGRSEGLGDARKLGYGRFMIEMAA